MYSVLLKAVQGRKLYARQADLTRILGPLLAAGVAGLCALPATACNYGGSVVSPTFSTVAAPVVAAPVYAQAEVAAPACEQAVVSADVVAAPVYAQPLVSTVVGGYSYPQAIVARRFVRGRVIVPRTRADVRVRVRG